MNVPSTEKETEEINKETEDSDASTELESFHGSEYEENDQLFDENVDKDVEWGRLHKEGANGVEEQCNDTYPLSNDLQSISNSSDEERHKPKPKYNEFNTNSEMESPVFYLGMFSSATVLAEAIRNYAVMKGKQKWFKKLESTKVRACCKKGCPWTLFASMFASTPFMYRANDFPDNQKPQNEVYSLLATRWFLDKACFGESIFLLLRIVSLKYIRALSLFPLNVHFYFLTSKLQKIPLNSGKNLKNTSNKRFFADID
ncbi:hypothetical protein LguiA_019817 [Lonicera macranthoides]